MISINEDDDCKLSLTCEITVKLDLKPVGKFKFSWSKPKIDLPNKIYIGELRQFHDTAIPLTKTEERELVKFMIRCNTDVLECNGVFYTRTNSGLTKIEHSKITREFNIQNHG